MGDGACVHQDVLYQPLQEESSPELSLYKGPALTVMKQMTKSIKRELRGCHGDDVNPGVHDGYEAI